MASEQLNNRNPSFNTTYDYDRRGRLTSISNSYFREGLFYERFGDWTPAYLNGNISAAQFGYGAGMGSLGNIYTRIEYDRLGRLTRADNTNGAYAVGGFGTRPLTYDRNGNILTMQRGTTPAVSYNYMSGTNKIASVGGNAYAHDLNGNMIATAKQNGTALDIDPFTQLTTRIRTDMNEFQHPTAFGYNAADERVLKRYRNNEDGDSSATLYLHGLSDYPLVEKADYVSSFQETRYIYGIGGLIATQRGERLSFAFKDHLGSTRVVVSSDGTSGVGYSYDALGNVISQSAFGNPTSAIAYQFTGQEYDDQTGLHNFRARRFNVQ